MAYQEEHATQFSEVEEAFQMEKIVAGKGEREGRA